MRLQQGMKLGILLTWLFGLAVMGTMGYVMYHFISKWW